MVIETKYLGEVEIDGEKVITFSQGLPGFSDERKFVILDLPGNELLQILQSVYSKDLAFIVTNPHHFYTDYEFKLDAPIVERLQIKDEKEIVILAIMTIQDPFHNSTINLQAPIIINVENKQAKQYILPPDTYEMKARISLSTNKERGE